MGNLVAKNAKGRGVSRPSGARDTIRTGGVHKGVARTSNGSRATAVVKAPAKPAKVAKPAGAAKPIPAARPAASAKSAVKTAPKPAPKAAPKPQPVARATKAKAATVVGAKARPGATKTTPPARPVAARAVVTTGRRPVAKTSALAAPAAKPVSKAAPPAKAARATALPAKKSTRTATKPTSPVAAPRNGSKGAHRRDAHPAKAGSNGHHSAARHGDAVRDFEGALGVFNRGNFAAARSAFQKIVETHASHTEIVARCTMYLAICSRRTQPVASVPKTPDSLYDRGIVEINRGQFEAAIALFEKALKSHPAKTGHVLYALAAAQVRSGRLDEGLRNLERAMDSHDVCRSQARQDPDFSAVWGNDRFQEIVGDPYEMW
jgi:hypothetical protein